MKLSITKRSKSELRLIPNLGLSDLELSPMICHTRKLTHWPSRYKQGIQMTKLRKKTEKNIKSNPICLSFCNTQNLLPKKRLQPSQNPKLNGYAKRLNMNYYLGSSLDSSLWKAPEAPKIKFQIKGKALNINEIQGDMVSNKIVRNTIKSSCSRNGSVWLGGHAHNPSINVSPW
ncbi:hypothetical protein SteCoe_26633 [Stentor coeruleus]|uniref:Uncharacterized protein n=1 Tax=Stentor coeruleus TaxID=5963 RepID=A0A1R2BCQ9_9CILI|nr:hypothetical protein SteCoe_26633 [Stentor coeruleus]